MLQMTEMKNEIHYLIWSGESEVAEEIHMADREEETRANLK